MINDFKVYAIILARGGSKSISKKNIYPLLGKPLIYYAISEAQKSKYIDRIIVSTDDDEIADIAGQCGAEVPFKRPQEISQDLSTDLEAFEHALFWLKDNEDDVSDIVVHLRPTAPLRRAEHIDFGIEMLVNIPDSHAVRSVALSPKHPLKMWQIDGNGRLKPLMTRPDLPEAYNAARQQCHQVFPVYVNNGSVDVVWSKTILDNKSMTGENIYGFVMDENDSINIDTLSDILAAEEILRKREQKE